MSIEVIHYSEEMSRVWDQFVWRANNGTLFHTRKFLSYHPKERFEDHSLIFKKKNRIVAVFPAVLKKREDQRILVSHAGTSYGGLVCKEQLPVRLAFDLIHVLLDYSVSQQIEQVIITLPPVIYDRQPNHYLDFALYKNGFQYQKREISSAIPLDFSVNNILDRFKPEARTAYRKAVKSGIEVRETEDFQSFYTILKKNLALRHNVIPTHSLEELLKLKGLFPQHIRQFGAFKGDRMIAGVINFICNDRVILVFYISHDARFQNYRPINSLFFEMIQWSIEQKYKFLDFGIFTVQEKPNWGLAKFKENFGAMGIFRDTFIKQF